MASSPIIEFATMHLKPNAPLEQEGTEAYKTWHEMTQMVGKTPGCLKQFFGRQMEDPTCALHVLVWSSPTAPQAFMATPDFGLFMDRLRSLSTSSSIEQLTLPAGADTPLAAIENAGCTEVFTGYGAEAKFAGAVRTFAGKLEAEKPAGYLGSMVCETIRDVVTGEGEEQKTGKAVKLVIGWESREAHLEAKGQAGGALGENIGLLRSGREEGNMYHVHLKQL